MTLLIVIVRAQGKTTAGESAVVVPTRSLAGVGRRSRGERTWHRKDYAVHISAIRKPRESDRARTYSSALLVLLHSPESDHRSPLPIHPHLQQLESSA